MYKNILIIKLCCIGDVLFTTPLLRTLKIAYRDSRITYMVGNWTREVIENNPNIDEILIFDPPFQERNVVKKFKSILNIVMTGRHKDFDLAIVCHRSPMAGILTLMMGIDERVGFNYKGRGLALTTGVPFDSQKHEVLRYLDLAEAIGIGDCGLNMEMFIKPDEDMAARNMLNWLGVNEKDVLVAISPGGGINPGTSMPSKRWTKMGYASVADTIIKKYSANIVFIGGKTDRDLVIEIMSIMKVKEKSLNIVDKTNWKQTAAIIKRCALFIGNDSGSLYVAAAVGTPTIGIFGPSNPKLVAPLGGNNVYIYKPVECSPCYNPDSVMERKSFECKDVKCLKEISITDVIEAVDMQLNRLSMVR